VALMTAPATPRSPTSRTCQADLLKIDGSFIVNMNQHPANVAIVEAIVAWRATWA
jgi:predicted signal transduction protein with EAL and GGDEF domain